LLKNILSYTILLLTFSSCEDFFSSTKEVDLGDLSDQVTVVGRLSNTDVSNELTRSQLSYGILISRSRSIIDTSNFKPIESANINLTSNDGLNIDFEYDERLGYYFPPNIGTSDFGGITVKENTNYELVVDVPGEDRVTASCETKTFGKVEEINIVKDDIAGDSGSTLDRVLINIADPEGENFYYLDVFYEGERVSEGVKNKFFRKGYLYNYSSIFDDAPELFNDQLFDGKTKTLEFWSERYESREEEIMNAVIILWSLSKEEYEFRKSISANEIADENPFAEPIIVFSNIENGVGIFSMSKAERFIIPWQ